jgi:O-antigen ligase
VGLVLLLGMSWIEQPARSWRAWLPMVILLLSLLLASSRRTGYILLVAGAGMALVLNREKLSLQKYRLAVLLGVLVILGLALSSSHLRMRVSLALSEVVQFLSLDSRQRAALETSVGIRLEYYVSTWRLIQDHFWLGLGSLKFGDAFWQINQQMGATNKALYGANPHNEYLWMWATKGVIGLLMYLAIWVQVCRMAWHKRDQLQRHGLWVLVTLFLISITSNSMSFDMVEGHFMMLVLLVFLAPGNLKLWPEKLKRV